VLGVVVGAALQHVLTRSQEARRQRQGMRSAAYVDYLRGATTTALAQKRSDRAKVAEGDALMADAKARMCVYGGSGVLEALATFSQRGASLATREGIEAFLQLCEAMRVETNVPTIARDDMARILFNGALADFRSTESHT
jgi:hypothetical protein